MTLLISTHLQTALAHHQAGRLAEAEKVYRQVLDSNPANADALGLLGRIAHQHGRFDDAVALIGRSTELQNSNPYSFNYLGEAHLELGQLDKASTCFQRALGLKADYAEAHLNLGVALAGLGRPEDAQRCYRQALEFDAGNVFALNNLGNALRETGRLDEAESSFRQALARSPELAAAHCNLGATLADAGRLAEAEGHYRDALACKPEFPLALDNLGLVQMRLGRLAEAERSFREAIALDPDYLSARVSLVSLQNYLPERTPGDIYAEHVEFGRRYDALLDPRPHGNLPQRERRLRIGYISGDLRDHATAFFIEPVLAGHERREFEIFCYYNHSRSDKVTVRLRGLADCWRDVALLGDEALANLIRADAIDIMVDLSGHTAYNRLTALARKPAPVQATWLGYLNTTGLKAIDYRITDGRAAPEGLFEAFHSEVLLRMPDSQWCYQPPEICPRVVPPPCIEAGTITFASFSKLAKIGSPVIELWSRLLERVPQSRLVIVAQGVSAASAQIVSEFNRGGIGVERLLLLDAGPFETYLAQHSEVDVMLDTFPYTGGTTTCHALWMGVPVVSLAGRTVTSRGGSSLLQAVGLGELVAESPDEYVRIASELAGDSRRLADLRLSMRDRVSRSPLTDGVTFTRNLERRYRSIWSAWCDARK